MNPGRISHADDTSFHPLSLYPFDTAVMSTGWAQAVAAMLSNHNAQSFAGSHRGAYRK